MAENRAADSLGDLLLREGLITNSQLETALRIQKETEKCLGRVLVEMGLISERVRMRLLQEKFGYDIVRINPRQIDRKVLELVPKSVALKYRLAPVKLEFDTLVVAMEDPTDVTILDHLRTLTGLRVRPAIAAIEEIEAVLSQYPDEPAPVEVIKKAPPVWLGILADALLFGLLAAPILIFLLYVPTNPELRSHFARPGAYIDIFIFTLLGYGIYAVIIFEIWALVFQRARSGPKEPPRPPSDIS